MDGVESWGRGGGLRERGEGEEEGWGEGEGKGEGWGGGRGGRAEVGGLRERERGGLRGRGRGLRERGRAEEGGLRGRAEGEGEGWGRGGRGRAEEGEGEGCRKISGFQKRRLHKPQNITYNKPHGSKKFQQLHRTIRSPHKTKWPVQKPPLECDDLPERKCDKGWWIVTVVSKYKQSSFSND